MKFTLFSEIEFEVAEPTMVIEAYCYQNDFYKSFDLSADPSIKRVNKIGARIDSKTLRKCSYKIRNTNKLGIYKYKDNLNQFLNLSDEEIELYIKELNKKVIAELLDIPGIGFSKATKLLH